MDLKYQTVVWLVIESLNDESLTVKAAYTEEDEAKWYGESIKHYTNSITIQAIGVDTLAPASLILEARAEEKKRIMIDQPHAQRS